MSALRAKLYSHLCAYLAAALASVFAAACTPAQKKPVVATALSADETRHESFEATLRELDEHPEYVDELFQLSLKHPAMLDRLLDDTAQQLSDEAFARRVSAHLAAHPDGLKATLIATLVEIKGKPEPSNAAAQAIEARPSETVAMLTQRDAAVRNTIHALAERIQRDERAQQAFVVALDENRELTAAVLARHPEVMGRLFKAIAKHGVDRGQDKLAAFVESLKQ